jgi:hypothetical protein
VTRPHQRCTVEHIPAFARAWKGRSLSGRPLGCRTDERLAKLARVAAGAVAVSVEPGSARAAANEAAVSCVLCPAIARSPPASADRQSTRSIRSGGDRGPLDHRLLVKGASWMQSRVLYDTGSLSDPRTIREAREHSWQVPRPLPPASMSGTQNRGPEPPRESADRLCLGRSAARPHPDRRIRNAAGSRSTVQPTFVPSRQFAIPPSARAT